MGIKRVDARLGVGFGFGVLLRFDLSSDDELADIVLLAQVEELADLFFGNGRRQSAHILPKSDCAL